MGSVGSGSQSADSRALGAMLASPRWYDTAAEEIVGAFYQAGGNAKRAAAALGVPWRTLRSWCQAHPELQRSLDAARDDIGGM